MRGGDDDAQEEGSEPAAGLARQISDLIAWAARLSRTGLGNASPAYLTAKADLLDRIAAERAAAAGPA